MTNSKYYILTEALEDCPVWVPGEMYCAGVQLAKGYWRNEEKTRASFITHPRTGERIYRTGDLGRYLPNGNIEFLGRVDFQIKIRGHRIEVGEIEATLTQHPSVRTAVVAASTQQHHQMRLIAYVVPDQKLTPKIEELSHFLSQKLPDYMMPSAFVFLDNLPVSVNGKVDRRALLDQDVLLQKLEVAYVAPKNELEKRITAVFQEILQLEKVGVNDNFFEQGGNSLLLTQVYRKLLTILPDDVQYFSLVDLFNYSTVRTLAVYLSQNRQVNPLKQQSLGVEQKLNQGKSRLKQRLEKSRLTK